LYGIGVRLSYYLSFSAAVLATIFGLTDELSGTRRGMIIITTAALIDTIFSNIRGSFAILEWYIVGLETLGLAGPVFWPSFVKRKVKRKDGDEERKEGVEYDFDDSTKADAGLFGMFGTIEVINLCLAPWIYFSLHDQGYKKSCKVTTFFFASFDIGARGWTIYMRIQAIINIVGGIFWILVCGWLLYYAIRASWKQKESEEVEEGDEKASSTSQWLDRIGKAFVMIIFGAISAYFAERVIHDNSISMDDATLASGSQLIPFLVGLFNFVVIVGKCIITAHSSHSSKSISLLRDMYVVANNSNRGGNQVDFEEIFDPRI